MFITAGYGEGRRRRREKREEEKKRREKTELFLTKTTSLNREVLWWIVDKASVLCVITRQTSRVHRRDSLQVRRVACLSHIYVFESSSSNVDNALVAVSLLQ